MRPAEALLSALDDLNGCLLRGEFRLLGHVADRIGQSLADLPDHPPDPVAGQELAAAAGRAMLLLEAASKGVAAARHRLAEIETVRTGLATYSGDGRRRLIPDGGEASKRI